jgi:hypothetical protein
MKHTFQASAKHLRPQEESFTLDQIMPGTVFTHDLGARKETASLSLPKAARDAVKKSLE